MRTDIIFDLDGTLLHTLPDIRHAINKALSDCGYPYRYSLKESRLLIGNGADMLVRRALREKGDDEEAFAALKAKYMPYYAAMQNDHAKPYNGIKGVLGYLKDKGCRLFVCTNKPAKLAREVVESHFGKLFEAVVGHEEGAPVKPDPTIVNSLLSANSIKREEALFVGDSAVDVDTAHNALLPCCLVKWGYGQYKKGLLEKADYVISKPKELIAIALR